ncbi:MAG TPA: tetratricopeptide repeat protein, partial [Chthoniobacteraceae bacterium]|nr:tetratricopeptide repeat protein [Chthoniobacteraceae bacterium]
CKPALIGFPFLLLLLDYWPLSRYNRPVSTDANGHYRQDFPSVFVRMVTEKIPFFAASFVMFAITVHAQSKIENSLDNFSFPVQVNHALVSSLAYIMRVFWPVKLTVFYPQAAESGLFVIVAFAFLLLGAISAAAFFNLKKFPWFFVGWFWFLGMLAPAIGWGAGGLYTGGDRFVYLASIGLYLIVIWGGWDLLSLLPKRRWIASLSMIAAISALTVCARIQCSYWNDGESLWTHALDVTKGNYLAYDNLANALVEKGDFEGALNDYNKALALRPNYAEAEDDFGVALDQKGKLQDAVNHYQKALGIRPDYPEAYIDLGEAFVESGRQDGLDIAIGVYQKALQYRQNYADAHYNLGKAYTQAANRYPTGSPQFEQALSAAIGEFKHALDIRPYYAEANFNLGFALSQPGPTQDLPKAIAYFIETLELNPNYAEAEYELAAAYFKTGDVEDAILHWKNALLLKPNYEEAHFNLGAAYAEQGQLDDAIAQYQKALEIGPHYVETYDSLGSAYFQKKEFQLALESFEKSLQIAPTYPSAKYHLAWFLSTCPNPALRNGKRAVELIENDAKTSNDPLLLRTLAAAYAETGRFPEAVKTAQDALEALKRFPNASAYSTNIENEIKIYQSGKPYHEVQ